MAPFLKRTRFILLVFFLTLVPVTAKGNREALQRRKREWIIAPKQLWENHDYTSSDSIARIRSDKENGSKIFYYLSGPGVDEPPQGIFRVERETGKVKILKILDRESRAFYYLKGSATYADGTLAEKNLDLKITVLDENDCTPIVAVQQVGYVHESSAAGTVVMRVTATDDDEENTVRSTMHYSIVEHSNTAGMFYMNSQTGEVLVQQSSLDRETQDTYKLTIQASDMNGQAGGNVGTGEIEIKLMDINDNIPYLERESYEGSVQENIINQEVMRIKAIDMDLMYSDNWLAAYEIVSGNEAGYFTITTDSKTNEGIIMINKALNYEEIKMLNLQVAVANKAEYNFGTGGALDFVSSSKSYPIKINVINQREPPRFQPTVKVVQMSEEGNFIGKIITNYAAIDSDTLKTATNIRYAKYLDKDNWLVIDEETADIRLNKLPDRESTFLKNGTYYAEIICTSKEFPSETATGTIAIQVEDFNDHCPELTSKSQTMCLNNNVIYITAIDADEFPNSAPFEFSIIQDDSKEKWMLEQLNDTTAILREQNNLWPGTYKVKVEVKDQQGKGCDDVQTVDVTVCTCLENSKNCVARSTSSRSFGAAGVLLLLLGLLLLLLIPLLLLFCLCGGAAGAGAFKPIPYETKPQLIAYHTEGQGEDKDVPLLHVPVEVDSGGIKTNDIGGYWSNGYHHEMGGGAGGAFNNSTMITKEIKQYQSVLNNSAGGLEVDYRDGRMMMQQEHLSQYRTSAFDGMALSDQFLGDYYLNKSSHFAQQSQPKDALLIHDYEGEGSLAGSVGCCSLIENDNDLGFLDDLGPKFKTLAEICQGSALVTDSVDASVSIKPARPVSPFRPSTSSHTHIHTHTETIRDKDRVNINIQPPMSKIASESSTIVQEEILTERSQGSATIPKVHIQEKMMAPSQTLLISQPSMCYAATPMYLVESKPQVMLVAGGTQQAVGSVGQIGLSQGLVQVGGFQGPQLVVGGTQQTVGQIGQVGLSQGLVQVGGFQGSQLVAGATQQAVGRVGQVGLNQGLVQVGGLQGSQGVVLVDNQVGMCGVTDQFILSQGTSSKSQQVVRNRSSSGEQVTQLGQGLVQTGYVYPEQGLEFRGQGMQFKTQAFSQGSTGSIEDFSQSPATPRMQGSQRVVQHKKVTVTERNVESNTRA